MARVCKPAISIFLGISVIAGAATLARAQALPAPWTSRDIGAPAVTGSAIESAGTYTVRGAGSDIWSSSDQFQFVYQAVTGDVDIRAQVLDVENVHTWTKGGVMIRAALAPAAPNAFGLVTPGSGLAFQRRVAAGADTMYTSGGSGTPPRWVRLVRAGDLFTSYVSADGVSWTLVGSDTIAMPATTYVGLAVTSVDAARSATVSFTDVSLNAGPPQQMLLPSPWTNRDVGSPALAGRASGSNGTFSVTGAGADAWGTADQFHFVYQAVDGDVEVIARLENIERRHEWSKAGVMIREGLNGSAAHGFMLGSADSGWAFQRRPASGTMTVHSPGAFSNPPGWVRLVRSGDTFSGYESTDGSTWVLVGTETIPMPQTVYVGLAVTSHNAGSTSTATFSNVAISRPTQSQSETAPAAGSTPYPASAPSLPGTIEAENFDNGGAGVAYSDTTAGNSGGHYRTTDVDIEPAADASGGYTVGWIFAGEWLKYTVNVTAAGTYTLEFRVASAGGGGTFHVEANGVDKTGPLTIPNTGGWLSWTTITRPGVSLSAGQQVWRVVMDTNGATGAVGNINFIRVTAGGGGGGSTPYGGTAVSLPGTVQAENFDNGGEGIAYHDLSPENSGGQYRTTGVDVDTTTDTGGGYTVGWMFAGEWLKYTVNVGSAGTYDVEVRVASAGVGGTFHIEVNGVDRTGPLTVPNTGGWQSWTTITRSGVSLSAGQQVWRVVMDTNGATTAVGNINFIRVLSGSGQPPTAAITSPANGATYTAPATITVNASASDSDGTVSRVDFYAGAQSIGSDTTSPYSISWNNVAAGTYALTAVAHDNSGATTTSAAVTVTVGTTPLPPTPAILVFTPSTDHATGVTSYWVAIRRAADPVSAAPLATRDIGKPTPSNNEITVDISAIVNPLPAGSYYAVVTATGPSGSSSSSPSPAFTR